jgi:hypothetical protein
MRTSTGMSEWLKVYLWHKRRPCFITTLIHYIYISIESQKRLTFEISNDKSTSVRILININKLLFAGDQCLIYDDTHQLQKHSDALHKSCNNYDMTIDIKKTELKEIGKSKKTFNTPKHLNIWAVFLWGMAKLTEIMSATC